MQSRNPETGDASRAVMAFVWWTAAVMVVATGIAAAGCGSQKTEPSISQQLERARQQSTPERQAVALVRVATRQRVTGDAAGAVKTALEAYELLAADGADAAGTAPRLVEIAAFLAQAGDKSTARKALTLVDQRAGAIADPVRMVSVLAAAGGVYGDRAAGLADAAAAKAILERAGAQATKIEERYRAEALAAVALGYSRGGIVQEAATMIEQLLATARGIDNPRAAAEGLAAAARVKAELGKADEAKALLEEAATAAREIERAENRAYALLAVGEATASVGDSTGALVLLDLAYAAADKVGDPEQRRVVLEKVSGMIDRLKKSGSVTGG